MLLVFVSHWEYWAKSRRASKEDRLVSPVTAPILICCIVPSCFLMWAALRGFKSSVDGTTDATAKLSPVHRRWMRIIAFGSLPLIVLGGVVGMVLRPAPNIFKSELIGCGVAGAVWILALWITARVIDHSIRASPQGSDTQRGR